MLTVLLAIGLAGAAILVAVAYRLGWQWTGLPAAQRIDERGRPAKTLWDWLQLLGIPLALAALAFLLNNAQSRREEQNEAQRAAQQRRVAVDAAREDTLTSYLAQMSELVLDRRLLRSLPGADVRAIASTATLTAVRRLNGQRRGLVIQFLADAGLLGSDTQSRAVALDKADVTQADLRHEFLLNVDLSDANLRQADLFRAVLGEVDFSRTNLSSANLRSAQFSNATLDDANMNSANVSNALFLTSSLQRTNLTKADLSGTVLDGADLRDANLRQADLSKAQLRGADLRDTDLAGADLDGADLAGADLRGARNADMTGSRGKPAHLP